MTESAWGLKLGVCLGCNCALPHADGLALWVPWLAVLLGLPDPGWDGLALAAGASLVPLALGQGWLVVVGPDWLTRHDKAHGAE